MSVCLLWRLRASIPRLPKFCFIVSRKTPPLACNVCLSSTQASSTTRTTSTFQPLPREELVTKFKSRLKDRPFTVGATGEGFPEFLAEPRESFPHGVLVNNPHKYSLAELTEKFMEYVKENLAHNPAILLRNLPAQTAQDFSIIAQRIPWKGLTYEGGTSFRTQIDENAGTYTANNDPDEITIDPHNEMSYSEAYPSKVSSIQMYTVRKLNEPSSTCLAEVDQNLSEVEPKIFDVEPKLSKNSEVD